MRNFKIFLVSFVFGTACTLALPIAALYGLTNYVSGVIRWNKNLIKKFEKHGHIS